MMWDVRIYWRINDYSEIRMIRSNLGLPQRMTLNGETSCMVNDETMKRLEKGQELGYITIRSRKRHDDIEMV